MSTDVCERCGHGRREAPGPAETLRRLVGMKPRRVMCLEPTELGPCPCLSRYHGR